MRTLAVIPARLGATRLPRKPLRQLAGLPLVVRVWKRVSEIGVAERVVVATDSEEVASAAAAHRVAEVAQRPEFADFDVIVNVQGDEPFVSRAAVLGAAGMVTEHGFPLGTAAVVADQRALGDPSVVKVVAADDGRAMYFSRAAIPYLREGDDARLQRSRIWQHLGIYAYARDALMQWVELPANPLEQIERLEQLRPLAAGIGMGVALVDEPARPGIDTEDDLERANRDWLALTTG